MGGFFDKNLMSLFPGFLPFERSRCNGREFIQCLNVYSKLVLLLIASCNANLLRKKSKH